MLAGTPEKASPKSDATVTESLNEGVTSEISKPTTSTKMLKIKKSPYRGISAAQLAKNTFKTQNKLPVKKREQKAELK